MLSNVGRFRIPPPLAPPRGVPACSVRMRKKSPALRGSFPSACPKSNAANNFLSELVYTDVVTGSFQLAGSALPPRSAERPPVMRAKTAADRLLGLDAGDWSILVLGAALTGLLVVLF